MATLNFGDRIAREATVLVGCSGILFDETGDKVLLTKRSDNGRWCLPGGQLDPGESITETCVREMVEETGLIIEVDHLVGVYSDPDMILTYGDENRYQLIAFHFAVRLKGGTLGLSNETTDVGYFTRAEITDLDLMDHHRQRIEDSFAGQRRTFVR